MPTLQVRDFPEDLYEKLKMAAQREHRSIAQQTIVAVENYLGGSNEQRTSVHDTRKMSDNASRRKIVLDRINTLPSFEVPEDFPSPEQIIREMRDSQ